ncbi:hypothetical protein BOX15_Mlig023799g1 [Macrostomum lignano]|uniref:Farnesyl pyrophosphate synthase n=1 Tax=Macrostomum lignano TaxID=282301 RepID=A0A267FWF0_9PLAT|nr:hypothetical protein BOX15_Mlig023799g1 [Macrostomum lignano]
MMMNGHSPMPSWQQLLATLDASFDSAKSAVLTRVDPTGASPVLGHLSRVLDYNVPHGKKTRGVTVLLAWAAFAKDRAIADVETACPAAWAVELLQASFLVHDDIMDGSQTRRGRPCWFRNDGVGLMAVNDGIFLDQALYALLSSAYSEHPQYSQLMDLFHSVTLTTCIGQALDMSLGVSGLTWSAYREMVCRKTAHYSFHLPVAAALLLRNRPELVDVAKPLLLRIGEYFQAQDDYLDFYGDPAETGKIGTDIQEAKCSWLALTALDRLRAAASAKPDGDASGGDNSPSPSEASSLLARFQDCYGQSEPDRVAAVGDIYRRLRLDAAYAEFEAAEFASIDASVEQLDSPELRLVCRTLLQLIHGRRK